MQKERKDKHFIKKPMYPGGPKAMREFVSQNLKYPEEAFRQKIEGTVTLRYEIDFKGNVTDAQILSSLGFGCDEEAIRVVKLFKFDVPPVRGLRVIFHNDIKVHFKLPKATAQSTQTIELQYNFTVESKTKKPEKTDDSSSGYTYTITWGA
jgi:TonB family protein